MEVEPSDAPARVIVNSRTGTVVISSRVRVSPAAVAHGSLSEAETLFTLCEEIGWIPVGETKELRKAMDEVSRMLTSLRRQQREAEGR